MATAMNRVMATATAIALEEVGNAEGGKSGSNGNKEGFGKQ